MTREIRTFINSNNNRRNSD